ncbi:Pyridoxal phosphate-dependent transferase protein [Raphanus sativus]|nr:Pyridoxal phosphate-dependent transferase protein [Raphanus sativus]
MIFPRTLPTETFEDHSIGKSIGIYRRTFPSEIFPTAVVLGISSEYLYSEEIPRNSAVSKPLFSCSAESCTYLLTKLELSLLDNIKDDIDFCVKLTREENLVFLPGEALGLKNWMRITIGVEAHMLEDALERLKGFCTRHTKRTDTETESPSTVENV